MAEQDNIEFVRERSLEVRYNISESVRILENFPEAFSPKHSGERAIMLDNMQQAAEESNRLARRLAKIATGDEEERSSAASFKILVEQGIISREAQTIIREGTDLRNNSNHEREILNYESLVAYITEARRVIPEFLDDVGKYLNTIK